MDELNKTLRDKAISFGMCDKFQSEWKENASNNELLEKYINGLYFCFKHDFPTNDFIKKNFSRFFLIDNHVFIDEEVYKNGNGTYVIMGNSSGVLDFSNYDAATVFIRQNCKVKIKVSGNAKVFVNVLEEAKVSVFNQGEKSKAYCYIFGKDTEVLTKGEVLMRHSEL